MNAPKAKKINKILEIHGDRRVDEYFWMNERENPEVTDYLNQENEYCDFVMQDTEAFQNELFEEMKARYKEDDESLPYFFNKYWYIVRFEKGKEYPIFSRKFQTLENEEEILLDVNILAEGEKFFEVGSVAVSPDNKLMSFSSDNVGRRIYTISFKNLESGEIFGDQIPNTTGKAVWANDNKHVFYTRKDDNLRAFQVFRHELGTDHASDVLVFHEEDETFDVNIFKTKSLEYIFIASSSTVSDEMWFIPANDVSAEWKVVQPRTEDLEYAVEHYEDEFYIITNADDATNFKIVKTKVANPGMENWVVVIPHRKETLLEGFEIFKKYLVLEERTEGLLQIKVIESPSGNSHY
ncbi:MAG: oligopeptidase B, partial [Kaistella sp.]